MPITDFTEVHRTHCCPGHCKYGDSDCPVANGQILPAYKCEDCTCLEMNPGAEVKAVAWWDKLSTHQQIEVYLRYGSYYN